MSCPRQKQIKNTLRFHSVSFFNCSPGSWFFFQVLLEESFELSLLHNFKKVFHDNGCHFSLFSPLSPLSINLNYLTAQTQIILGSFLAGH